MVILAYLVTTPIRLLATILTARIFGTGPASEAFFASNRFAEILFNLVAGGALGSAFIPTFTGLLAKKDQLTAWKLASAITNLVLLVLTLLSLLTIIFARQVVHYILAPGFSLVDPAKEALAADLLRIQVPSALVFGLSGLLMGILNAHQHFLLPALAPAMYNLGWIIGLVVLAPTMGVHGLAWGVLLGAGLHLLIQVPMLFSLPDRRYSLYPGIEIIAGAGSVDIDAAAPSGCGNCPIKFSVEYLTGITAAGRQRDRHQPGLDSDAHAPGCHCPVHCHRRLADFFSPGRPGQIEAYALLAGSHVARSAPLGHSRQHLVWCSCVSRSSGFYISMAARLMPSPPGWWRGLCSGMEPVWSVIAWLRSSAAPFTPCMIPVHRSWSESLP